VKRYQLKVLSWMIKHGYEWIDDLSKELGKRGSASLFEWGKRILSELMKMTNFMSCANMNSQGNKPLTYSMNRSLSEILLQPLLLGRL